MVFEHEGEHASQWAAIGSIAAKIGCTAETLRNWVRQAERDQGAAAGLTTRRAGADQGAGAREPRAAAGERDPAQGVGVFRPGGARPPTEVMVAVHRRAPRRVRGRADLQRAADRPVDLLRACRPGGPIRPGCRRARGATRSSARQIRRVWRRELPGLRRRARSGGSSAGRASTVARCTVARLMRRDGPAGRRSRQGSSRRRSPTRRAPCPPDLVNRQFQATAPERSCGWRTSPTSRPGSGFVYVAFVIDVFARRIVGWRVSRSLRSGLRPRCAGAGAARSPSGDRGPRPSQRPRRAIPVDPLHRAAGRGRHRAVGRQRRRLLRQRPGRDRSSACSRPR